MLSAYHDVSWSAMAELLDTMRTRVLNMALEIQDEVGEDDPDLKQVDSACKNRISQIIIQHIQGGQDFVPTDSSAVTVQQQIQIHNWGKLAAALQDSGVSQGAIEELHHAFKLDGKRMGPEVRDWIKKTAPNVLSAGVKVGTSIGQQLLFELLKQHYGWG